MRFILGSEECLVLYVVGIKGVCMDCANLVLGLSQNELSFGLGGGDGDVVNAIDTTRQR